MRIKYFNRYELKYVIPAGQQATIAADLAGHVTQDAHSEADGRYAISSLYFDTPTYKAYTDKIEGHRFRRKVRIRVYGNELAADDAPCFVEIKQRNNKSLQKKRIFIPYTDALSLCNGESVESQSVGLSDTDQAVWQEIDYLAHSLQLRPACIVRYQRTAFNGTEHDPGLRITFDTNLKYRVHALSLRHDTEAEDHYFLPPDWCIMEIKVNQRVPYWLSELLSRHNCTLRRVSKYCAALETGKVVRHNQIILPQP